MLLLWLNPVFLGVQRKITVFHHSSYGIGPLLHVMEIRRCLTSLRQKWPVSGAGSAYGSLFGPGIYLAESCAILKSGCRSAARAVGSWTL